MRIAVFDYRLIANNPVGSCHRRMLVGLCEEHEFTVFSVEFENPRPDRIRWVRVPAPRRPLALLFVAYHLLAPLYYLAHRLRSGVSFDQVQFVESNLSFGDLSYSHFCHRAYLKRHWKQAGAGGLRGTLRRLDHWLHALLEPHVYRRARRIVVPSHGLARELAEEYPAAAEKIAVLPNAVDVERMQPPPEFDRKAVRAGLGLKHDDLALVFVALGQFERKGLPLILEALDRLARPDLRLVVVGGERDLVAAWRGRADCPSLRGRVSFVGMRRDVRPYLWAGDAFVLPSFYEVFPLVSLEAAAAGLPLLVTPLNGVEEFLRDGVNGLRLERSVDGLLAGLSRLCALAPDARRALGRQARADVMRYRTENFVADWRGVYRQAAASGLPACEEVY